MANLLSAGGAEIYVSGATANTDPDGKTTGTVTRDTTVKNDRGNASYKCDSGAGNAAAYVEFGFTAQGSTFTVAKASFIFTNLPTSEARIIWLGSGWSLRIAPTTGAFRVYDTAGVQRGGDVGAVVADGVTVYRVEFASAVGTGTNRAVLRVDGRVLLDTGLFSGGTSIPGFARFGWATAPGASCVVNVDDCVAYDDNGNLQEPLFSLGDTRCLLALPVSDGSRVGWTAGGGGTTNLFDALNNTPPVGVNSPTNASQIKDGNKNSTDAYTTNVQTPLAAGVLVTDRVAAAIAATWVANSGSNALTGNFATTNPTTSFSATGPATAAGTWPTNWTRGSQMTQNPTVAVATTPTFQITKGTSSNNTLYDCFMGIYYIVVPRLTLDQGTPMVIGQAVNRAAVFMRGLRRQWRRRPDGLLVPEYG